MKSEEVTRRNYESKAFRNIHWIRCADNLIVSAKLLAPKILEVWESFRINAEDKTTPLLPDRYQRTYFMLIAFALENLLKASLVSKHSLRYKQEFHDSSKFPKEFEGHDLVKLAMQVSTNYRVAHALTAKADAATIHIIS